MKRKIVLVIVLCLIGTSHVFAARVDGDYRVVFDGVPQSLLDVNGDQVSPITLNGVMYLPIRSIMDLIGQHTEWSESDRTVYVSDGGMIHDYNSVTTTTEAINIDLDTKNKSSVVYHGVKQDVGCILYRGSAYVPIQGIKGCSVHVDTDKKIISIKV